MNCCREPASGCPKSPALCWLIRDCTWKWKVTPIAWVVTTTTCSFPATAPKLCAITWSNKAFPRARSFPAVSERRNLWPPTTRRKDASRTAAWSWCSPAKRSAASTPRTQAPPRQIHLSKTRYRLRKRNPAGFLLLLRSPSSDRNRLQSGGWDFIMTQDPADRAKHIIRGSPGDKTIALDVRPGSSYLQDRRLGEEVAYGQADRSFDFGLERVSHQDQVKPLVVTGLFYILQAAGRSHAVSGPFQGLGVEAHSGVAGHHQQQ